MKNWIKSELAMVLTIIALFEFTSCTVEEKKFTYVVKGKFIDANSNGTFQNVKIEAYNTFTYKAFKYLGTCYVNANGEFSLQYDLNTNLTGNYLKLYFVDTSFAAATKFESLPIGESWFKTIYVSDSATVDIFLNRDLGLNDTLFIPSFGPTYKFIGPTQNKHLGKVKIINTGYYHQCIYAIGNYNLQRNKSEVNFVPTGDPIVDTLTLILK